MYDLNSYAYNFFSFVIFFLFFLFVVFLLNVAECVENTVILTTLINNQNLNNKKGESDILNMTLFIII